MADSEEEVNHDETSLHEESEPEQEIFMNHPQHNVSNQSTLICICHTLRVQKWTGKSMMHCTTDFFKWKLKCENI